MKFDDNDRTDLLVSAKMLNPTLGEVFRYPLELDTEDIQREIDRARSLKKQEADRYQQYIDRLGMLLCFPERN